MRHALLCFCLISATAETLADSINVYKWTDAQGVTHYSEVPPSADNVKRIELAADPPTASPPQDYYSIANQARRLEQQRLERERLEAELEAARLRAQRNDAQQAAAQAAAALYAKQAQQPERIYSPIWVPRRTGPPRHHAHWPRERPEPAPRHHTGRNPAFAPPEQWLRSHPRLWRKELQAQRDYNRNRDR